MRTATNPSRVTLNSLLPSLPSLSVVGGDPFRRFKVVGLYSALPKPNSQVFELHSQCGETMPCESNSAEQASKASSETRME